MSTVQAPIAASSVPQGAIETHPLFRLFNPASVAVIGASTNPAKVGNRICRQLIAGGYAGELVPVSIRPGCIAGVRTLTSLRERSDGVDVAVITTATEQVADAIRDCASTGTRFAIIHTAGFAETGDAGRALEREVTRIAREGGVRLVGPNCMQILNTSARLNLVGTPFPEGRIAMISQSGNLVRAVTEECGPLGLGFSSFVTVGNQADLKVHDYLDYLADDPDSKVILIYVEGLSAGTGQAFMDAARRAVVRKPVLLLKGGVTGAGARSSVSHTGSLAGEARVMMQAMEQAGVLVADRLDEVVPMLDALSRLPVPEGRRIAVVGGGGGHATLCADALEKAGLDVPEFSEETKAAVSLHLPPRAGVRNPVDFTGASEREIAVYAKVPEITLSTDADAVLLYGLYAGYRTDLEAPGNTYVNTSGLIVDMVRRTGKPAIMQTVYADRDHPSLRILREGGVPVMQSVEHAAAALAALCDYGAYRRREEQRPGRSDPGDGVRLSPDLVAAARARPAANLTEAESLSVLVSVGVSVIPHRSAGTAADSEAAAAGIGYPVVLKALSPDLIHKSDAGGVALDLAGPEAVRAAHAGIAARTGAKDVLVAAYRPGGVELIVGGYRDPVFGPVLMFGLGGTSVELIDDIALRVLPIGKDDAESMLGGFKGHRLLQPHRGKPGVDRKALADMLLRVARLMESCPEISEIDLNPVLAFPDAALVADARMVLSRDDGTSR